MDTLVLSATYEPVARVSWQRALTLFFQGKVEVVEEYEDRTIRSVTVEIRMPSVVRFLKAISRHKKAIKFSRENVYTRDKGRCQYCGIKTPRPEATYDHVVPRAQGGKTCWENVVICCFNCNQRKADKTPDQAKMRLRSVPVKPKKLDDRLRLTFTWHKGMPESWKSWLADMAYWYSELETDD